MPEGKINKLNALGGAISAWSKIAFTVICIIGYGFLTYYQIKGNSSAIGELKILIQDQTKLDSRELEIYSQRSDKRYSRAMNVADELDDENKDQNKLIIELIRDVEFIKGKLDK
jgi:hypothetical protein